MNSPTDDVAGFQNQIPGFEAATGFHLYGEGVSIPDGDKPAKKFGGRIESQAHGLLQALLPGRSILTFLNIPVACWQCKNCFE